MPTPEPKLPWYQFSLRSLFLLTAFVAVLCSLGVCSDWSLAAVIGVGGTTGGIVTRTWRGIVLGVLAGGVSAFVTAKVGVIIWERIRPVTMWVPSWPSEVINGIKIAAVIGSLIGGIAGGLSARRRSGRHG